MTRVGPARTVVVGAGLMGRWHAHAIHRVGSTVAAVVDPDRDAAGRLGRRHGAALADDLGAALRDHRPTVVHVCSPLPTHDALATEALEAGVPVVIEKPVTDDTEGTERLLAVASRTGTFLCPVHQFVFQRGFLRSRDRLVDINPVRAVDFVACSAGGVGRPAPELDRIVADILPHPLSMLQRLFAHVLVSAEWIVQRSAPGEWRISTRRVTPPVSLLISMSGRPTQNTLRLVGDGGSHHLDLFHGFLTTERADASRKGKITRPFRAAATTLTVAATNLIRRAARREPAYPGLRHLIAECHRAALADGPSPIGAEETLAVARARDAILQAAERG